MKSGKHKFDASVWKKDGKFKIYMPARTAGAPLVLEYDSLEKVKELEESLAELKEDVEEKTRKLDQREQALKEKGMLIDQLDRRIRKLEKLVRERVKD